MSIILRNAMIIDGRGDGLARGYLVVEGHYIQKVGKGSGPDMKKGDNAIDLDGKTLFPGLIDCHVHLCLDGSSDPIQSLEKDSDPMIALKATKFAYQTLLAGVTTIRDMGARNHVDIQLRNAIQMGLVPGPRMICSGKFVCMTGGHGWPIGREADGPDAVRQAVREQLKAGADIIKLIATGGVMTPGVDPGAAQLSYEELKAGVEEAHKAGRRTASHALGNQGVKTALRAGIDSIEHGVFLDDEAIELFLERKTALVPTISAPYHILEKGIKSGIPVSTVEKAQRVNHVHIESAKKAFHAGVMIGMGTDAGTPFNCHGANLKELELLCGLGLTPMETLVTAMGKAAEVLGWNDRIGTIEEGKLADLVIVEGDPLKDITILQNKERIVAVMKEGQFFRKVI